MIRQGGRKGEKEEKEEEEEGGRMGEGKGGRCVVCLKREKEGVSRKQRWVCIVTYPCITSIRRLFIHGLNHHGMHTSPPPMHPCSPSRSLWWRRRKRRRKARGKEKLRV